MLSALGSSGLTKVEPLGCKPPAPPPPKEKTKI